MAQKKGRTPSKKPRRTKKRKQGPDRIAKFVESLRSTWTRKKVIIVYGLSFFFLILLFAFVGEQEFFKKFSEPLLTVYAQISSAILNVLGQPTKAVGDVISSAGFSITIKKGCDAIAPMVLYIVAVLSFPISRKYKWQGLLFGVGFLFFLNILRIISLYLIGAYAYQFFDFAHVQLWQVLFIALTVITWIYWMKWASSKEFNEAQT